MMMGWLVGWLIDCQAYVLYLFLSLMLSYLNADEDDCEVVNYLEKKLVHQRQLTAQSSSAVGWLWRWACRCCSPPTNSRNLGKSFLRYCKFGTLQYCLIRPLTALAVIIFSELCCALRAGCSIAFYSLTHSLTHSRSAAAGVYDESDYSLDSANLYIQCAINLSVCYAFVVLGQFYHHLADRLAPFEPVGKFLCIKFVIFFAFWQSVVLFVLVSLKIIKTTGLYCILLDRIVCFLVLSRIMYLSFMYFVWCLHR
jgi:hypothetical protein